jgi:hypothetical protein
VNLNEFAVLTTVSTVARSVQNPLIDNLPNETVLAIKIVI